jgi:hypothetical protein
MKQRKISEKAINSQLDNYVLEYQKLDNLYDKHNVNHKVLRFLEKKAGDKIIYFYRYFINKRDEEGGKHGRI